METPCWMLIRVTPRAAPRLGESVRVCRYATPTAQDEGVMAAVTDEGVVFDILPPLKARPTHPQVRYASAGDWGEVVRVERFGMGGLDLLAEVALTHHADIPF